MSWRTPHNPFLPRRGQTYRSWVLSGQRGRFFWWLLCTPCRGPWMLR